MSISNEEWDQRILCIDGACIGVIGKDGHCKECGKVYTGDLPLPEPHAAHDEDEKPQSDDRVDDAKTDECLVSDDEWKDRVLCPDGNCIGVIGPDGRCGECGHVFSSSSESPADPSHLSTPVEMRSSSTVDDTTDTESHDDHADNTANPDSFHP